VIPRRLLFLAIAVASLAAPAPAGAIPNTCPTTGPDAGIVNITEPAPGTTFAGQVTVRGRASAPTALSRIELFVGDALKDFQVVDPAQNNVDYILRFDVAGVQSDRPTLTVVACGAAPVRGVASVEVAVDRGAAVTAPPIAITPVERSDDRPGTTSRTGPVWVGAAFGVAGLAGLLAATRVSRAREASEPFLGAEEAEARAPGRRRRPAVPAGAVSPPGPIRPRRQVADPSGAARGRRAKAAAPAPAPNGRWPVRGRGAGERPEPAAGDGRPSPPR
jgi:hypothetical protein